MEMNEMVIAAEKMQLQETVARLQGLCHLDANRPAGQRVSSLTHVFAEEDRFIVVQGSAHRMGALFTELFTKRPEFRSVVKEALDNMYMVDGFKTI